MSQLASAIARSWLAVACASHVTRGEAGGFMQVCHGKAGPLRRLQPLMAWSCGQRNWG